MRRRRQLGQRGFTIVELMIATSVLSVMLLLATVILSSIGNLYYKAVNQSHIQDDTRNIASQLSQDLELNGGSVLSGAGVYCIDGSIRYSYVIGKQLGNGTTHVLWRDVNPNPASCTSANLNLAKPSATGEELVSPKARLSQFKISLTSPYTITVNIAFGDDDLLCSPSSSGNTCASTGTMPAADFTKGDLTCKGNAGEQFCATANLSTTVLQRLTGS